MEKKLHELFETANAEFWLSLDSGMSEQFGEMVTEYLLAHEDKASVKMICKYYKTWIEDHPEAAPNK